MRRHHPVDVVGRGRVQAAGGRVREDLVDGVLGVFLVGSDQSRRAALDPTGHILADLLGAIGVAHASAVIEDHARALVEWIPATSCPV
jgi:hypothetical protein